MLPKGCQAVFRTCRASGLMVLVPRTGTVLGRDGKGKGEECSERRSDGEPEGTWQKEARVYVFLLMSFL